MRVGVVGAGRMGRPMVQRLAGAGHEVRVLARSDAAAAALTEDGAVAVRDLGAVAAGAEAVVICVHTDEQVRQVALDDGLIDALPDGALLIVHTTGHPGTADALAERAAGRGIEVLDAPVSGGPHDIAAGRITLLVGGSDEAVARARPALAAYGDPILHVGGRGNGQRVKLINNAVFAANIGLLAAAVDLGAQLGVSEAALLEALPQGSSNSFALSGVARAGSVAGFAAAAGEFIGKDVAVVRQVVADLGGDLGALAAAHQTLAGLLTVPEHARALA
ncbi:NAD(P)-dependent oxidoreductase [Cryptosporangium aurantiacum]|uniref:3-hydroxyisobutyrate dehydrogenase n=1 Tax=Cryptosporangium aurantiacum TaxID=134849 RepID=A0A1M7KMW1_9ACTN|nr:NAD(P)-dependent oxidoreductase [Cryptosporangium aurantiacum]SHM66733.1 3-hydroxyisobutyrate dehydrogenase [Cryptosporangium aurantiacum]